MRPDDRSVQADCWRPRFALQVESKAGGGKSGPAAADQCAPTTGAEKAAPEQYRSISVRLALLLVSLRPGTQFSVDFTTNIVESNFRYTQGSDYLRRRRNLVLGHRKVL